MTITERNLLIATMMGLNIIKCNSDLCIVDQDNWVIDIWHPDQSAEQREMIKDWLIEQGCEFLIWRNKEGSSISIKKDKGFPSFNKSESEAFLQAVAELCLTLKNQKP